MTGGTRPRENVLFSSGEQMICLRHSSRRAGRDGSLDQAASCGPSNPSAGYVTHQHTALALKLHVTRLPPCEHACTVPSRASLPRRTRCPQLATHSALSHVFQLLVGLGQSETSTADDVLHYGPTKATPPPLPYMASEPRPECSSCPPFCGCARPRPPEGGLGILASRLLRGVGGS